MAFSGVVMAIGFVEAASSTAIAAAFSRSAGINETRSKLAHLALTAITAITIKIVAMVKKRGDIRNMVLSPCVFSENNLRPRENLSVILKSEKIGL